MPLSTIYSTSAGTWYLLITIGASGQVRFQSGAGQLPDYFGSIYQARRS
jgi:hypothetical protein